VARRVPFAFHVDTFAHPTRPMGKQLVQEDFTLFSQHGPVLFELPHFLRDFDKDVRSSRFTSKDDFGFVIDIGRSDVSTFLIEDPSNSETGHRASWKQDALIEEDGRVDQRHSEAEHVWSR
jgi:hypothetical protein